MLGVAKGDPTLTSISQRCLDASQGCFSVNVRKADNARCASMNWLGNVVLTPSSLTVIIESLTRILVG